MKFAIPLETMFSESPMEQRFARAAGMGIEGVAFLGWRAKDIDAIDHARRAAGVEIPYIGCFPQWPPTSLCNPAEKDTFRAELEEALAVAERIEAPLLIGISGDRIVGIPEERLWITLRDNVAWAAERCEQRKKTFILENVNRYEMPNVLLERFTDAARLVDEVASDNLRLCFDTMHVQLTEGDITHMIQEHAAKIANVHLEAVPHRGEPGTGELDDRYVLRTLQDTGFRGFVVLEYSPQGSTEESLKRSLDYLMRP